REVGGVELGIQPTKLLNLHLNLSVVGHRLPLPNFKQRVEANGVTGDASGVGCGGQLSVRGSVDPHQAVGLGGGGVGGVDIAIAVQGVELHPERCLGRLDAEGGENESVPAGCVGGAGDDAANHVDFLAVEPLL